MTVVDTVDDRAERLMVNWVAWQNSCHSFKLSLDRNAYESKTVLVNEEEALQVEQVLLKIKSVNETVYRALIEYYRNRDKMFVQQISEKLKITPNTLRHRVKTGNEYLLGYLF